MCIRAIYQGSDVNMLDDVLSAVDAEVARFILHNAILGPLMDQKTRVLCTHNVQVVVLNPVLLLECSHLLFKIYNLVGRKIISLFFF